MSNDGGTSSGVENRPRPNAPLSEVGLLAEEILALAVATRATEALLLRAQAALLAWLGEGDRVEQCGFASLNSLALEVLGIRPRTVRERLALNRIFFRYPAMERAFLGGRLTACQVLAVAPLMTDAGIGAERDRSRPPGCEGNSSTDEGAGWVEAAACLSVRELRFQVRRKKMERDRDERTRHLEECPEDVDGRMISFAAPVGFRVVFDQMMELSRKVLGRDAPVYECIEAMLFETQLVGMGPEQESPDCAAMRTIPVRPSHTVPHRAEAIAHARQTLEEVRSYMNDVMDLIESGEPRSPHDALCSLRQIHLLRAPQKVLFARLLRDLRRTHAMDLLGYRSMAELVEDRLGLSERSARNRVAESLLFETDEEIARAFGAGEISIMQAHLIRRLASSNSRRPFVERAREVTWRQFQREYRLLELLKKCDLGQVAKRPFPQSRVEEALIAALGGDRDAIEEELRQRGVDPLPPGASADPAENPLLMDRLEMLVELLAMSQWDEVPRTGDADRQTSAAVRREVTVRFWAPTPIADDLLHATNQFRRRERPWIPMWAAMVLLFAEVAEIWEQQDPGHRPVRSKILKRDRYRCVIPGCTSRCHLEASHNRPRSQGGTNDPENLSAVCHTHHHRGIHAGHVTVTGRAPHALRFALGIRRDGTPLLIYYGNRLVRGAFDDDTGGGLGT